MSKAIDLTGKRFDRLIAIAPAGKKFGSVLWLCLCDCGNHVTKRTGELLGANQKVKGCVLCGKRALQAARTKHGDTTHGSAKPIYNAWHNMHARCSNPKPRYRYWQGRGIKVCAEWSEYLPFKTWALANGYTEGLALDRINPDGHYEPSNCRWVTVSQNTIYSLDRRYGK